MSSPYTFKKEIADKLLDKYPEAPTKTLARIAYRDNPSVWPNLDAARSYFRVQRGANGVKMRRESTDKSHYRKPQQTGDPFGRLPEPLREFEEWSAVQFDGPMQALVLSDLQIPFYDRDATALAMKYGKKHGADFILLNGDICDHYAQSDFVKDPRLRKFSNEVRAVKDFLNVLRDTFPKARIVYKKANHEDRYERYMMVKAPEFLDIPQFEFASVMGLSDNDIQLVGDSRPIRLGKLNVIHGHEYRFSISNPVSPARGLFLRGISNALCSHFHQSSQHSKRSLEQKVITNWSTGCLCQLHPAFMPMNDWNLGFAFVGVDEDGQFEVDNMRIINGVAYR